MSTPPLDAHDPRRHDPQRRPGARSRGGSGARRVRHAWSALARDQRFAAGAALGLFVCLFLPWYKTTAPVLVRGARTSVDTGHESALQAFTFVEAAVLLVAAGVLLLLFRRAERRAFHLPGGDGSVIVAAGLWAAFLIVWRFFDRPDLGKGVTVGLSWGIFVALGVAAVLAYAGSRIRAAQHPEPPLERAEEEAPPPHAPGTEVTPTLHDTPVRPPDDATDETRVHRGDPAPDDPTSALPRDR